MKDLDRTLLNIIISAKKVQAPTRTDRSGVHWEWIMGIGKDHVMYITMDDEAYQEILTNISTK